MKALLILAVLLGFNLAYAKTNCSYGNKSDMTSKRTYSHLEPSKEEGSKAGTSKSGISG